MQDTGLGFFSLQTCCSKFYVEVKYLLWVHERNTTQSVRWGSWGAENLCACQPGRGRAAPVLLSLTEFSLQPWHLCQRLSGRALLGWVSTPTMSGFKPVTHLAFICTLLTCAHDLNSSVRLQWIKRRPDSSPKCWAKLFWNSKTVSGNRNHAHIFKILILPYLEI